MTEPDTSDAAPRASYLFDGRRITVADLLQAGRLHAGEELTFDRPRIGETHTATVTDRGWLRLNDGQELRTPSRAATAAATTGASFDGWTAWKLPDGRLLDTVRQEFLDDQAEGSAHAPQSSEDIAAAARHRWFKEARQRAEQGDPLTLTGDALRGLWTNASSGAWLVQQIHAELDNHHLRTQPAFDKVPGRTALRMLTVPSASDAPEQTEQGQPVAPADEQPEVGLSVGSLSSAMSEVASLPPDATFEQAYTLMTMDDYSQIPIMQGTRTVRGAVTWKSIAKARHINPGATLADAIVEAVVVSYKLDLMDVLPMLEESDFVLVKDDTNEITGIVTTTDVTHAYGRMATPFQLIGELDQRLRRLIADRFTIDQVNGWCSQGRSSALASFNDMSFGDYQQVLQNPDAWKQLDWNLDRKIFNKRLDEIRKIRNDLMHFNPEPFPEGAVGKIRRVIKLLRDHTD